MAVDQEEAALRVGLAGAGVDHRPKQERGDAAAGRAGAQHGDALLRQRHARHVDGGEQGARGDGGGALDIVIEGAQPVAIAFEQAGGVGAGEILPVEQHVGPTFRHGRDEVLDERVVLLARHALVPPADIDRVIQPFPVVRSDVEQDRQRLVRMDAGARGVERQLADRDAHASRALIAETQDALAIADDDDARPIETGVGQNLPNAAPVRIAEEDAAGLAPYFAEALAAFADGGRVDQRQRLREIMGEHGVE